MRTSLPPISDLRPRVTHYGASQPSATPGGPLQLHPLCGQMAMNGRGPTRGFYTADVARVTCKKCARSLAAQAK
jgi:hypothetical protein